MVQKILKPRKLRTQLLLGISVVLIMAMSTFSYLVLTKEVEQITQNKMTQARVLAKNMAAIGGDLILSRDYASIEQMLQRAVVFPSVMEIRVVDARGRHLGDVTKNAEGNIEVHYSLPSVELPRLTDTSMNISKDRMEVWEPIYLGEFIGAVHVTLDMLEIEQAKRRIWQSNTLVSGLIVVVTLILLVYVLRRPIRSLQRYTAFADGMDNMKGDQVEVDEQSQEFKKLGEALNQVSSRLHLQNSEILEAMNELSRLASFPENNPNIVLSMDQDGQLIYINPHGRQMLLSLNLAEKDIMKLLPDDALKIIRKCLDDNVTVRALEKSCCNHTLLWTISPLPEQHQVQCYAHDVSESRRAEEQARMALMEKSIAEAANSAKSAFLANMSHEIRTPLTSIIGFSETLLDSEQNMHDRIDAIQTINKAGTHLLKIINDILDLSKIEAAKLEVEMMHTEICPLLEDVCALANLQAEAKGIGLKVTYEFPLPAVIMTDSLRLKQILLNLVNNAIKFTENGEVTVLVRADVIQEMLWFDVTDTGIGMTAAELSRLFNAFSQADSSTTRRFGGTGLGLHVSRLLAEKLGGDIAVSSIPGKGSCFSLSVATGTVDRNQLINEMPGANVNHGVVSMINNKSKVCGKVLLAEDNENNQKLITHYLNKLGAEVVIAQNGTEAVNLAQQGSYDLIFMDMQMPVMDGLEAMRQLRSMGYKKPIVSLTANVMQTDIDKCMAAGADGFLGKPIDVKRFNEVIQKYLPAQSQGPTTTLNVEALRSTLLDESPDMADLVESFIEKFPGIIAVIVDACQRADYVLLKARVHDLKSIGGSYGYPQVSKVAAKIEFELAKQNYQGLANYIDELKQLQLRIERGYQRSA